MFTSIFESVMNESSIAPFADWCKDFSSSFGPMIPIAIILLAMGLGFFGNRIIEFVRPVLLFLIGFVASVYWLYPLLKPEIPEVPGYVVGIIVGVFTAVISRFIYDIIYVGAIGFDTYNICMNALFFTEITAMTKGNLVLSICVATAVVIVAIIARQHLEMLITALAGGMGVAYFGNQVVNYAGAFNSEVSTTVFIIGLIFAAPMFIYQYYNRTLY